MINLLTRQASPFTVVRAAIIPDMAERFAGGEDWEVGDDPVVSPNASVVATAPERPRLKSIERERYVRWAFTIVLTTFLALSLAGVFGVRTATSSASSDDYEVLVRYGRVTRPGLATPFAIEVSTRDGRAITEPIRLAVSADYLEMFDENGIDPDPASATATRDEVIWEFSAPGTDTLVVALDFRLEPGVQWGRTGSVRLLENGQTAVEAEFHTWVTP